MMKCEHCGAEIIRIITMGGCMVCNAGAVPYWLFAHPNTSVLTPNGKMLSCSLAGPADKAHGIGYTLHTCFEGEHPQNDGEDG